MKLRDNLLAGFANSVWSALVGLAVVPLYLKYLGMEAYGLIGFFVTTQAVIQLLDMGLGPTITREVARCSASGDLKEAGKLVHSLAVVYWSLAGVIGLVVVWMAPAIAQSWLQSAQLPREAVTHAVMLMGLVLASRWPIGLYQGALVGAHQLRVSSSVNIMMVTFANVGAVGVLILVSPTVTAFFGWQACVGLVYTLTIRWAAWRVIGRSKDVRFDVAELKRIWRFSVGMSGIALSGLVFTQMDKILLSKILGLHEFGHYMLATAVVSGLYALIMPIYNVVYPRMSALVAAGDTEQLTNLYRFGTRMFAAMLFPIAMVLVVFSEDLVRVWTGDSHIASSVGPVISLLAVGTALNGAMFFPYALQLAHGMTWIPLSINIGLMCFLVPMVVLLAHTYGALGGAMAWLLSEMLYVMLGPGLTHRYILKGLTFRWLLFDIGVPLGVSVVVGLTAHYTLMGGNVSVHARLLCGFALAILSAAGLLWLSPRLRSLAWSHMGWTTAPKPYAGTKTFF